MEQRARSPRYPSIPLGEAVDLARRLFAGDGMNAVDREVAAGHIGYSGINGASAQALASLAQYGLTETSGKGQLRLTGLALDIIEPNGDVERAKSLHQAAWTPKLFSDLRERFPNTTPSEANLRAHLIRQHFQTSALKSVIPAYLRTCEYLVEEGVSESHGHTPTPGVDSQSNQPLRGSPNMESQPHTRQAVAPPPHPVDPPQAGVRREVFGLEEGGEVVITLPNRRLSTESIEDLDAWMQIVARKLRRMAAAPVGATALDGQTSPRAATSETEDEHD